jgi:hypothetical protein
LEGPTQALSSGWGWRQDPNREILEWGCAAELRTVPTKVIGTSVMDSSS